MLLTDFASGTVYNGGMRVIYADSMILLNFAIDYLLLLATGKICALPLKRWRMGLGALFGGVFALFCALCPHLASPAIKLGGGIIAAAIAFGGLGPFLRTAMVFLAVSAAFGGAVWGAVSLGGGRVGAMSPRTLILSFAFCYAALSLVFKGRGCLLGRETAAVQVFFRGENVVFTALRDTGNRLRDSAGRPVMTAELSALSPLFPELELSPDFDGPTLLLSLNALPGAEGRCRLFPCLTATDPSALLPAFRPDSILLDGKSAPHCYIAIVPGPLSSVGAYRAIF